MPRRKNEPIDLAVRVVAGIADARLRDVTGIAASDVYSDAVAEFIRALFEAIAKFHGLTYNGLDRSRILPSCDGPPGGEQVHVLVAAAWLADEWHKTHTPAAVALGGLYQRLLGCEASILESGPYPILSLAPIKRSARKSSGSYYTPDALIGRILDGALDSVLDHAGSAVDPIPSLFRVKVRDPACGSGLFLIAGARRIAARLTTAGFCGNAIAGAVRHCVEGVDIDPLAVEICRFCLWLECGGDVTPTELETRIVRADSLTDEVSIVDVVVGNPPWLSLSGRQRVRFDARYLARLGERYPAIREWPALHSAFLLAASALCRDGGRVGLVLPLPVAYLSGYAGVRAEIDRVTDAVCVVDAGEAAFDGVTQATGLFSFRVDRTRNHPDRDGRPWPIVSRADGRAIVNEPHPDIVRLLALPTVPPRTFGDPGVHTGNMSQMLIHSEPGGDPGRFHPIRQGRDIASFQCGLPRLFLDADPEFGPEHYCRILDLARYRAVPILLRQTSDRPIAARHVDPTYFRNSILACHGLPDIPHEVMLAVLNSELIASWYRSQFGDASQLRFPQVKVRNLQKLPLFDAARLSEIAGTIRGRVRELEAGGSGGLSTKIETLVRRLYELGDADLP